MLLGVKAALLVKFEPFLINLLKIIKTKIIKKEKFK